MSIEFNTQKFFTLVPTINPVYKEALLKDKEALKRHGILENPLRLCHFLAQIMHETGGLTKLVENLSYSTERLPQVWPSRFLPKGPLDPKEYARNPEKLGNAVYGNRKELGNLSEGDGFKFRGRSALQTTGKANYAVVTKIVKKYNPDAPDFVVDPDKIATVEWCIKSAAANWEANNCNSAADADDITLVTKRVNGGTIGLPERKKDLAKIKAVLMV